MAIMTMGALAMLTACDRTAQGGTGDGGPAAQPALLLSAEDILTLAPRKQASGPAVTGSILPEKRADLRAEVSAIVLSVLKENGDPVKRGQLLVQLDDTSIRDTLASAQTAAEAASQAYDQAQRQYERMVKLREGLRRLGLQTTGSTTAVIPVLLGDEWRAYRWARRLLEQS